MGALYQVAITEILGLETCIDGVMMDPIDPPEATVTVESCKDLSDSLGQEVLIAGTHTGTAEDGYELTIGCSKYSGLVAPWKNNARKAVNNGNKERSKNCGQ